MESVVAESVDVMFRVDSQGDVFALFPGVAGTHEPHTCSCYQHVGQHSSADLTACIRTSRPATPDECAPLKHELEAAPYHYVLAVVKRTQRRHLAERIAQTR